MVFDSAKVSCHHLTPSLNRPRVLVAQSRELLLLATTSSSSSARMVLDPPLGSLHPFSAPSPQVTDNLLRWLFSQLIRLRFRDQLDPLYTWAQTIPLIKTPLTSNVVSEPRQEFLQSSSITSFLTLNSSVKVQVFQLIVLALFRVFDPPVLKPSTQTSLSLPLEPLNQIHFLFRGENYRFYVKPRR